VHVTGADALRNAVHALAPRHGAAEPESFALALSHHLVLEDAAVERAKARVEMRPWTRAVLGDRPRGRTFLRGGEERRVAVANRMRDGEVRIESGVRGLEVLWSDAPEFGGRRSGAYARPEGGSLVVLGIDALWRYGWAEVPYAVQWRQSRAALVAVLTEQRFASAHEAAHGLARAIIEQAPAVSGVSLVLTVRRHPLMDVASFGVTDGGAVYGAGADAIERVEAEVRRDELEVDG
jgi:urate oxidase